MEEELPFAAERVWALIRDVGSVARWGPGIRACRLEGEGVGAVRTLDMGAMVFVEKIERLDDASRTFCYSIFAGPMPVRDYLASVAVREGAPGSCRVSWSCRFDAAGLSEREAREVAGSLEGAYRGMIAGLRRALAGA